MLRRLLIPVALAAGLALLIPSLATANSAIVCGPGSNEVTVNLTNYPAGVPVTVSWIATTDVAGQAIDGDVAFAGPRTSFTVPLSGLVTVSTTYWKDIRTSTADCRTPVSAQPTPVTPAPQPGSPTGTPVKPRPPAKPFRWTCSKLKALGAGRNTYRIVGNRARPRFSYYSCNPLPAKPVTCGWVLAHYYGQARKNMIRKHDLPEECGPRFPDVPVAG